MHPYDLRFPCVIPAESMLDLAGQVVASVYPTGHPRLVWFTQVSKVHDCDTWAARLYVNAIAMLGQDDPAFGQLALRTGPDSPECRAEFERHWRGFLMAVGYPTSTVDFTNYALFALAVLQRTILIEQVHSLTSNRPGGRALVRNLVAQVVPWARRHGISTIRTSATNEHAARIFERNGFVETASDLFAPPVRFRKALALAIPSG